MSRKTRHRKSPQKRKGRKTKRQPRRLLFYLVIASLIAIAISLGVFFYVDRLVKRKLAGDEHPILAALLTDTLRVSSLTPLTPKALKEELVARGYRPTMTTPERPGEFYESEGRFQIFLRPALLSNGTKSDAYIARYDSHDHKVSIPSRPESTSFLLEPQVLAPLGVGGEQRASHYRALPDFPKNLVNALLAIEDQRFYSHQGIDLIGIARAMAKNISAMRLLQGGSTITQQLAKNVILSPERSFKRKFLELFAALSLEFRLPKEKILEWYLNEVYLGQEGPVAIHGFPEASNSFFGKDIRELNLSEAALLAGLVRAPSAYSPRTHLSRAIERRGLVLEAMKEGGYISESEKVAAQKTKPTIIRQAKYQRLAPHYTEAVRNVLSEKVDIDAAIAAGIQIRTGILLPYQKCAETAVQEGLLKIEKNYPSVHRKDRPLEGGLVSMEPHSGLVRAWVGSRDYSENQFDHVSQGIRQIGSTVKPFLYLTALDGELNHYKIATVVSVLADEPMTIDQIGQRSWEPENFDRKFRGDVSLRYALENSLNLPAVYIAQKVGLDSFARTLESFHVVEKASPVPSLALGTADTTLLNLTSGFSALGNGGIYVTPRLYVSVNSPEGAPLVSTPLEETRVASEDAVFVLTDLLKGVIDRGTGRSVRTSGYQGAAAGKTGTSNEARDAWFVGFTPNLATGVWVGYDDNSKIGLTGGALAAPIWAEYMKCIEPWHESPDFVPPPGVTWQDIDSSTRELWTENCPEDSRIREVFVRGTEPRTSCSAHGNVTREEIPSPDVPIPKDRRRKEGFWESIFG